MYLPKKYQGTDEVVPEFIRNYPFATLIGFADGQTLINHLPLNFEENALWGHLAFANPSWKLMVDQKVTAIFHGPHAYIDHRWYAEPHNEVPTWNYAVVHIVGRLRALHAPTDLIAALDRLQKAMIAAPSWADHTPPDLAAEGVLEKSIVGLKIEIEDIQVKNKMSQNKNEDNRERVMQKLATTGRAEDLATANYMRKLYE
jgi:transcriptional regulator